MVDMLNIDGYFHHKRCIMNFLKRLLALPTWVIFTIVQSGLTDKHELKHEQIPLDIWTTNRTNLCVVFDILIWSHMVSTLPMFLIGLHYIQNDYNLLMGLL